MKTKDRILIIDDDQMFLGMVQSMLHDEGYEIAANTNVREGLERLDRFDPDVLILDWQMPGITGIEAIDMIRKQQKYDSLYIIMLSGKIMTDNIVTAITAGADDYVIKPFSSEELMARVLNGVRSRRRRSLGNENREAILKGLQKIETLSQQLANTSAKDKRSSSWNTDIRVIVSDLKDLLKSYSS
ncbi:MAG: response regulator [Bacteriovoracaceae bacterium]|nr:response regulator [Bacteroidota bacterium]